ncbi:MAG: HAMP domain-containing sensor histidine kinase [Nitrospirota bacterium]
MARWINKISGRPSLWVKSLLLFLSVVAVSLSATLILKHLIIKDFREYLEGELEDRIYWVMANIEGTYERYNGWKPEAIAENTVWAFMMGFETEIKDTDGNTVMDTRKASEFLSPIMKRRVASFGLFKNKEIYSDPRTYPLFLRGKEIGEISIRVRQQPKEKIFQKRADTFLAVSLVIIGIFSIVLSVFSSRSLSMPIKKLTNAARAISKGDLEKRVEVKSRDEVGELASAFNHMAQALHTQELLRRKLTSNIAHEIRTPLSTIRAELEGMLDGIIPTDRDNLASINEEIERLKRILNGIDDLSAAEASRVSLNKRHLDMNELVSSTVDRMSRLFSEKGVAIEFIPAGKIYLSADPDRLCQIIINLLKNALNATERGGKVTVMTGYLNKNAFVSIEDTGHGIKNEDKPFIFERFYKGKVGGLGIGLTIAKELAEAHGGRIEVESEPAKGSKFIVIIPFTTYS